MNCCDNKNTLNNQLQQRFIPPQSSSATLTLPPPGLYEGIRFAWINMTTTPSRPFHITALRLVCQIKPQNWAGKFAAAGDDKLSRIWYLGAYTVKVNLLADQFGSILIYRGTKIRAQIQIISNSRIYNPTLNPRPSGDRFSWTGDAHVAQATAMAALGNFDFVSEAF